MDVELGLTPALTELEFLGGGVHHQKETEQCLEPAAGADVTKNGGHARKFTFMAHLPQRESVP